MKFDMEILGKDIAHMVKDYVSQSFKELSDKIDNLKLQKGEKGEDGKSVTIDDVKPLIQDEIKHAVSLIPAPKDGADGEKGIDGKDGKDADIDMVVDKLYFKLFASDDFAQRLVKLIPVPKDGKDGKDGIDGKDAIIDYLALAKSIDTDNLIKLISKTLDIKPIVASELEIMKSAIIDSVLKSMPLPQNGKDGANGVDGKDWQSIDKEEVISEVLKAIPAPLNGKDGTSVSIDDLKPFLDASIAKWQLEFERNAYDTLQKTVAMFPKPEKGEKGEDGFGVDTFEQVDDRTVKATFKRDNEIIEKVFKFPTVIYRGVYQKGFHEKGDAVTYAGSLWIAKSDTDEVPSQSEHWQLAVKRGANGKDADKA